MVLGRSGRRWSRRVSSARRLDELLNAETEPSTRRKPDTGLRRDIRLNDLTFAYPGRDAVLRGVNLTLKQGEFVAVVGPSGSGKSTVLGLVSRFLEPKSGFVSFDGMPASLLSTRSIRHQMAIVSQDTFLFRLSLRENIRFGRPSATDEEVEAAAREAEIHDTIKRLPNGYDTVVGEGGFSMSGGQRQRIAIARALIRNAPILLLDEATSALDPATEASVNETLLRAGRGRTTIFVTHRLSGVVQADRIVVVAGGMIAEDGTHATLLAKEGLYSELWKKQQGFTLSSDGALAQISAERLRDIPLLRPLSLTQLEALAPKFVSMRVSPGQAVINEGERANLFYIIARGLVMVSKRNDVDDDVEVARLGDGDQFGELALLNDSPRTATVTTRTECLFLTLNRAQFLELLETTPDVKAMVERIAGERAQPTPSTAGSWQGATVVM
ncbi:MAG: ATP-binding cassette domain-containing protein [Polyangiaceae bacterium]